jgi:hypothetical protein
VPVTFGHCFLFFLIFYSLFFTALPLPCPVSILSFVAKGQKEEVTQGTGSVFFFLLLPGTG